jgi:HAD superfamily hydrolase (TIGR01509 family)
MAAGHSGLGLRPEQGYAGVMDSKVPQGRIELVVFDLGRVLVRICNDWVHACATAGVEVSLEKLDPAALFQLRDLVHQVEVNAVSFDQFADQVGRTLGATSGQIHAASEAFLTGLYPGVPELLSELDAAGVKTSCLSNTNDHHWKLLGDPAHPAFSPLARLTYLFASHLIGARKPDDGIYAHLERQTGIAAGAILFFDDVQENVDAARKRGWHAHWIDPSLDDPLPQIRAALRRYQVLPD